MMENTQLTFKPFHNLKFPDHYKNRLEPKRKTMKERKPSVVINKQVFEEMYRRYKGGEFKSGADFSRAFDLSTASGVTWHNKCRVRLVEEQSKQKESTSTESMEGSLRAKIKELEGKLLAATGRATIANNTIAHMKENAKSGASKDLALNTRLLGEKDAEIAKLNAKVEILKDLLKERL